MFQSRFTDNNFSTECRDATATKKKKKKKNSAAIINRYLDFVQKRGLISLVNDYHVDNSLKESLVYKYFGSIVNNRSKNGHWAIRSDFCKLSGQIH